MKSIFSSSFIVLVTLSSLLAYPLSVLSAPAKHGSASNHTSVAGKKHTPKPAAANTAFIPQAPHFVIYSDKASGFTGPPPASSLVVRPLIHSC